MSFDPLSSSSSPPAMLLTLRISGMTCGKCERLIREAAEDVDGVVDVITVSKAEGVAKVRVRGGGEEKVKKKVVAEVENLVNGKFKVKDVKEEKDEDERDDDEGERIFHFMNFKCRS